MATPMTPPMIAPIGPPIVAPNDAPPISPTAIEVSPLGSGDFGRKEPHLKHKYCLSPGVEGNLFSVSHFRHLTIIAVNPLSAYYWPINQPQFGGSGHWRLFGSYLILLQAT